jgi:hypothetical protein
MGLTREDAARIGASDYPMLLQISDWGGPVALWARIVHGIQGESTTAMQEGTLAEPYIRALYRNRTGYELLGPASWDHPMYPWLRCHPDDVSVPPDGRIPLELKRYRPEGWGPEGTDAVPLGVWVQVQVQTGVGLDMGEAEQERADVAALIRGELRLYMVPFHADVYERCIDAGERFWMDFVLPKRFPEGPNLRLLERDVDALRRLFPAPKPEAPLLEWENLSIGEQDLVRRWVDANKARRAWAAQEKALAGQVAMLLRDAPGVTLPEQMGRRVDYDTQAGVPRLDVKALRAELHGMPQGREMLALLDRFTTKEDTRPLVAR